MKIEQRRSNFSQFTDSMWLKWEHDGVSGGIDLDQDELLGFAVDMLDIAIDCLRGYKGNTEEADDLMCKAMELINT